MKSFPIDFKQPLNSSQNSIDLVRVLLDVYWERITTCQHCKDPLISKYLCSLLWVHTCLADPLACFTFSATPPKSCTSFVCFKSSSLSPFPPTERRAPKTCSYRVPNCASCRASLRSLIQQNIYVSHFWKLDEHLSKINLASSIFGIQEFTLSYVSK